MRAALLLVVLAIGACTPAAEAPAAPTGELRGTYTLAGGGAGLDIVGPLVAGFERRNPKTHWQILDVGPRAGVDLLARGVVELAVSSTQPDPDRNLSSFPFAVTAVGIAVNANNPVGALSRDQVRDIFSGKLTDWAAVGGPPGQILVATRSESSAIRQAFVAFFFDADTTFAKGAIVLRDRDQTLNAVRSLSHAIGIVRLSASTRADPSIRLLTIDGVAPAQQNIASGAYRAQGPLYLVWDPNRLNPAAKAFLDFATSPEGKAITLTSP